MTGCLKPQVVIVPSSMVPEPIGAEPGYYKVSKAFLDSQFKQNRVLLEELEKCKIKTNQ